MKKDAKKIDKNGKEMTKNISYKLQFIDSAIFMTSSSSHFFFYIYIYILAEASHKRGGYGYKNVKCVKLNATIVSVFLNAQGLQII